MRALMRVRGFPSMVALLVAPGMFAVCVPATQIPIIQGQRRSSRIDLSCAVAARR